MSPPSEPRGLPVDRERLVAVARSRTPARILVGRSGPAYRTETYLELRRDHAAAVDAVHAELDLRRDLGPEVVDRFRLFEVTSQAGSKDEYLMRPDLGRRLSSSARGRLRKLGSSGADLQVAIGDGLSSKAVALQVPALLPLLARLARDGNLGFGRPFFIRYCRVGILNDIGDVLDPTVVVLLVGERPGLATAESLSAYLAFRPRPGHTDAQRNLISNIHHRGTPPEAAARRILGLVETLRHAGTSGVAVKEGELALGDGSRSELPEAGDRQPMDTAHPSPTTTEKGPTAASTSTGRGGRS